LARLEERRSGNHLPGARGEDVVRAFDGADAAADAARDHACDLAQERLVVASSHGGVEIDHLHFRKLLEAPHPAEHIVVLYGEPLALDELDDGAALEID